MPKSFENMYLKIVASDPNQKGQNLRNFIFGTTVKPAGYGKRDLQ